MTLPVELRDRQSWLTQADEAHRARDGGEAEQEREAGGDERAERDEQDQQRDRERERLGLLEVALERAP